MNPRRVRPACSGPASGGVLRGREARACPPRRAKVKLTCCTRDDREVSALSERTRLIRVTVCLICHRCGNISCRRRSVPVVCYFFLPSSSATSVHMWVWRKQVRVPVVASLFTSFNGSLFNKGALWRSTTCRGLSVCPRPFLPPPTDPQWID